MLNIGTGQYETCNKNQCDFREKKNCKLHFTCYDKISKNLSVLKSTFKDIDWLNTKHIFRFSALKVQGNVRNK